MGDEIHTQDLYLVFMVKEGLTCNETLRIELLRMNGFYWCQSGEYSEKYENTSVFEY